MKKVRKISVEFEQVAKGVQTVDVEVENMTINDMYMAINCIIQSIMERTKASKKNVVTSLLGYLFTDEVVTMEFTEY